MVVIVMKILSKVSFSAANANVKTEWSNFPNINSNSNVTKHECFFNSLPTFVWDCADVY